MPIASPIARHEIREEIQRRILAGESKPGERLSQQSLARELGVAQGTVRESLLELQWLGLVESVDHLGVFVEKLDVARICEAYLVREVLEGLAARLACSTCQPSDVAELRNLAEQIWKLAQLHRGRIDEAPSLDRGFHLQIIEIFRTTALLKWLAEEVSGAGYGGTGFRDTPSSGVRRAYWDC